MPINGLLREGRPSSVTFGDSFPRRGEAQRVEKTPALPYRECRGDHWSPASLAQQRAFRDGFLTRHTGTGEQCSPLQEFFDKLPIMTLYPFCGAFATKKEERSASLAVKLLVVVTVKLGLTDGLDFFLDVKALFQCGVNGHQAQQAGQPQAG